MQLIALGINHKTASIEVRERVSFSLDKLAEALILLKKQPHINEAFILSTCNRTELYCVIDEQITTAQQQNLLSDWLTQYHGVNKQELNRSIYVYFQLDAVRHLLRVACGLDSMVLGEPQILGQLKLAYQNAQRQHSIGSLLDKLLQHSFAVAKQVRTDTAIGSSPVSVAFAAVRLAQQIFGELNQYTALLIGAGETIELAARHLHQNGLKRMIIANRTLERARQLATEFNAYAITLPEMPAHLAEADIVLSSTASPTPILHQDEVKAAIKKRKHKVMFMVDIAVPRDIAPDVADLEDVFLYSVDDLNEVISDNLRSREEAARQAEEIIDTQVSHFHGWLQSLYAVNAICDIRNQAEQHRARLLNKAKSMLCKGKTAEQALEHLAYSLTNALLHTPCAQLRQAGYNGHYEVVEMAKQLYQLTEPNELS